MAVGVDGGNLMTVEVVAVVVMVDCGDVVVDRDISKLILASSLQWRFVVSDSDGGRHGVVSQCWQSYCCNGCWC